MAYHFDPFLDRRRLPCIPKGGAFMSTATTTYATDPDRPNECDAARSHPTRCRQRLIPLFQYRLLDWILEYGEAFVPTVADRFETPRGAPRYFIGGAVQTLAKTRMISTTGERRAARTGGRHGCIVEVWRLAPGIERSAIADRKGRHPIPPKKSSSHETTIHQTQGGRRV